MKNTGLNSGFMMPQYTAAALVSECKVLSHPASVDSIPSSLGQEDHVSMGATSALKCWQIIDNAETVLAIELLCAGQALDYRLPTKPGLGPRIALETLRQSIPHAESDRPYGEDIQTSLHLLRDQAVLDPVEKSLSGLV
jgi:histidine ammonia-lyase